MPKLREIPIKTPRVVLSPEERERRRHASRQRYRNAQAQMRDRNLHARLEQELAYRGGSVSASELIALGDGMLSYARRASDRGQFIMVETKDHGVIYSAVSEMNRLA